MKTIILLISIILISSAIGANLGKHARENLIKPRIRNTLQNQTKITVHLIPHTHDDVGWLKTPDQYYYGDRSDITWAGVRYIISSVMTELLADPAKNFIYVEVAFFKRWWEEQTQEVQQQVKELVANGSLEFINGGWVMNDEAAVYYEDSIDQMTFGHKFLLQNFNVTPTIGWHIDPFGHASAQAALFAQMGFNAFYFSRIDYQDKAYRLINKSMDMLWTPQTSQGSENNIFTSVNYNHYEAPPYFCFDIRCSDSPVMDDPLLENDNAEDMASLFVNYFVDMAIHYQRPVLLHTLGSDFNYQAAHINFINYDEVLAQISSNSSYDFIQFKYSTPGKYIAELYSLNISFPTKSDDFFPYADEDDAYWTGYFTSRVAVKGYVRQTGKLFQATKKLVATVLLNNQSNYVVNNWETVDTAIYVMEDAMGTAQHHDAVTGTEKQAVAYDYQYRLYNATQTVLQDVVTPIIQEISNTQGIQFEGLSQCNLNVSANQCPILSNLTSNQNLTVVLYNPTQNDRIGSLIRIKVPNQQIQVVDINNNTIPSTIICANQTDPTDCDLYFNASVSQFNFSYYTLYTNKTTPINNSTNITNSASYTIQINASQTITYVPNTQTFNLTNCPNASNVSSCYNTSFILSYRYYDSYQSDNEQNSGAYIFRPSSSEMNTSLLYSTPSSILAWNNSNLITQISLYSSNITTHVRVYQDWTQGIEIETFVNSIDLDQNSTSQGQGKEVVIQLQSPRINNNNTFYTDSMGMEMQQRIFNYRPTWNLSVTQNVSGNYYPINSAIYIQDINTQERMTLCNDRAQGGSSIYNGQVELMIHRRLVDDDARGVGEPLNETDWDGEGLRQYVTHVVQFSHPAYNIASNQRTIQFNNDQQTQVFLANPIVSSTINKRSLEQRTYFNNKRALQSINTDSTGSNLVKIYARSQNLTSHLIRFHNLNENINVTITSDTFNVPFYNAPSIVEMSLSGNQPRATMIANRYNWNNYTSFTNADAPNDYLVNNTIQLRPLEIRTFLVTYPTSSNLIDEVDSIDIF